MNAHWELYAKLTNPCIHTYDFILKQKNIEIESGWLFNQLNITDVDYPRGHKDRTDESLTLTAIDQIPKILLKQVYQKIKIDYLLYNYKIPKFLRDFEI